MVMVGSWKGHPPGRARQSGLTQKLSARLQAIRYLVLLQESLAVTIGNPRRHIVWSAPHFIQPALLHRNGLIHLVLKTLEGARIIIRAQGLHDCLYVDFATAAIVSIVVHLAEARPMGVVRRLHGTLK